MLTISVKPQVRVLTRQLDDFAKRQVPFAQARAVTEVARRVQRAETAALPQVLDRPTPFTMRAFAVQGATKANPQATVFAKDIQARYLAPEEFQIPQVVAKAALLRPVDIPMNQYGNIPRGIIGRLVAGGDAFVARLTFKDGQTISGIWARLSQRQAKRSGHRLKLLVRFAAPVVPKTRLGFRERGAAIVEAEIGPELEGQLRAAMATARP